MFKFESYYHIINIWRINSLNLSDIFSMMIVFLTVVSTRCDSKSSDVLPMFFSFESMSNSWINLTHTSWPRITILGQQYQQFQWRLDFPDLEKRILYQKGPREFVVMNLKGISYISFSWLWFSFDTWGALLKIGTMTKCVQFIF